MKNKIEVKFKQMFSNMHNRCQNNKNYKDIKVCKKWSKYKKFKEEMFEEYKDHYNKNNGDSTLERCNYDKDYKPSNCGFATIAEQQRNRSNNINLSYKGDTQCLSEWSRSLGISYIVLWKRLFQYGWSNTNSFVVPVRKYHKHK